MLSAALNTVGDLCHVSVGAPGDRGRRAESVRRRDTPTAGDCEINAIRDDVRQAAAGEGGNEA